MGSSPRVWGTLNRRWYVVYRDGLIPTGVGNTRVKRTKDSHSWAHPHGCGEHLSVFRSRRVSWGSSPRVWGTRASTWFEKTPPGLIPTGVGNTMIPKVDIGTGTAHPHGCGEHRHVEHARLVLWGSSPRVWGTPVPITPLLQSLGLIPTGVGNTTRAGWWTNNVGAHPHGCGEHTHLLTPCRTTTGSSPRVWGTRVATTGLQNRTGLIPTGVGNTGRTNAPPVAGTAHPHGCGEHELARGLKRPRRGSSPRVWGTLTRALTDITEARLIPTGVGNTPRRS